MPSDKPDAIRKWRNTTAQTLTATAFAEKVLENGLRVIGPYEGYVYCAQETEEGHDLYRAYQSKKWLYQARQVATQANVAGGAVKVDISLATGQIAKLVHVHGINSGTNSIYCEILDEDNTGNYRLAAIASAAATRFNLPSIGTAANATLNLVDSNGMLLAPGEKLSIFQADAGAQNDTLTVAITLELYNLATEPTWSKARSTNAADVTLAASTISEDNTLQELVC